MQHLLEKSAEVPNSVQLLKDNAAIVRKDMYLTRELLTLAQPRANQITKKDPTAILRDDLWSSAFMIFLHSVFVILVCNFVTGACLSAAERVLALSVRGQAPA